MIYVTGDCHADFNKFAAKRFPEQKEMTYDDIVIVCGDFGIWHNDNTERYRLKWLNQKPFTTVFCDGNHENFDRLYSDEFPIVDFHGGKAHKIREHIYHLMRGSVYDFEGKKFFVFGGARSHDIQDGILDRDNFDSNEAFLAAIKQWYADDKWFRINHISWWQQELPSKEEMAFGLKTLEENNFEVDYIITHCAPQEIASAMGYRGSDMLTQYLNTIASDTKFTRWYFGHYHNELTVYGKFVLLYNRIERIV